MPCEDFKKVYFNAFDSGGIVYTIHEQPADHSSLSRSLIQDMPIRGACAQLGQFLICAPRREETVRVVRRHPSLSFIQAPRQTRIVPELLSAYGVHYAPAVKSFEEQLQSKKSSHGIWQILTLRKALRAWVSACLCS